MVAPIALPAAPQNAAAAAQPQQTLKSTPAVQALINAGHKAQQAKPPRLEAAEKLYRDALNAARGSNDRVGESAALRNIGNIGALRGQPAVALDFYNQSVAVSQAAGDKRGLADTLYNIALLIRMAQPARAIELADQCRALYHEIGQTKQESEALSFMGALYNRSGQPDKARERYEQALALAQSVGDPKAEADADWYLAGLASSGIRPEGNQ